MLRWLSSNWQILVEVLLIAVAIYYVLKALRGTRGAGILRGVVVLFTLAFLLVSLLWAYTELYRITYLIEQFLTLFVFVLIVVFQPELRRGFIRLGLQSFLGSVFRREAAMIREVVDAVHRMSEYRIGALITFEREIGLKTYIEGGTHLDAQVTSGLLGAIFSPGGPLHDGAAIISEHRVVAAGSLIPKTEKTRLSPSRYSPSWRLRSCRGRRASPGSKCLSISISASRRSEISRANPPTSMRPSPVAMK